ncbi:tetratricopeptide repeat protein [Streptomyces sp. SM13]|uniref:tetratricopeptide repeat protein n=1 Tax=Streptomyces sp. SM13 TaxID=1983803 RepID=UPI000CD50911|nr:tetratricopeptide repeat protein [Streptomyces sp. SM13]
MAEEREAPSAVVAGVGNSVSDGVFHAPVVQAGSVSGGVHTYYAQPPYLALPPVTEWTRLDAADPVTFGVRRTRRLPGEPPLPPYVERDCDRELDARISVVAQEGGLVVVTGAPLSGRTRTAWVSLCANLSGATRVFSPPPGSDLRGLPAVLRAPGEEGCVLWLDDLEDHLGEHGLTPALLADLVRLGVPVLATMDDEEYDARRFGASGRAGVLSWAEPVELRREWSKDELERLNTFDGDLRLRAAAALHGEHRVPEYLVLGPELMEEWWRARRPEAHPRGHLLVRAAIDLVRCGVPNVRMPTDLLQKAQALYPDESAAVPAEAFEDAIDWAVGHRHGLTGLLAPGSRPDTWKVSVSLVAEVDSRPDSPAVPLGMWALALDTMSWTTLGRKRVAVEAEQTLASRAEGDPEIMVLLGQICAEGFRRDSAESWFRRAADTGHIEAAARLGELLVARGEGTEAIPYLEKAAMTGHVEAQYHLGTVLAARAHSWLSLAAASGHPEAARALPALRTATDPPPDTVEA